MNLRHYFNIPTFNKIGHVERMNEGLYQIWHMSTGRKEGGEGGRTSDGEITMRGTSGQNGG